MTDHRTTVPERHTLRRLLLVRHGLPDYRDGLPGDELPGPPLSEIGYEQANQAATLLRQFNVEAIHASPLARTWQTAACVGRAVKVWPRVDPDLREWHRTERIHDVTVRLTRWLVRWLRGRQCCAIVVSHASPLLAILRSALYLPHVGWYKTGHPNQLELFSGDRFEVTMAAVFELLIEPRIVTARCLFHPHPRVCHARDGRTLPRLPRPVPGTGENRFVRRPNWLHLIGYRAPGASSAGPP